MSKVNTLGRLVRLSALSDTAFPVGGFSFSDGLESAVACGIVSDATSLEEYAHTIMHQTAHTDGVAAIEAYRATQNEDFDLLRQIDTALLCTKTPTELRLKALRMGRRLAELAARTAPTHTTIEWHRRVQTENSSGCYAVSLAVLCSSVGVTAEEMFGALMFGSLATVLGAALRLLRVSHFDTWRTLFRLSERADELYEQVRELPISEMHTFAPLVDVLSGVHEQGFSRMFMN